MDESSEFGQDYAREQLRRSRQPLRRFIKYFYLNNILGDVQGPTIDFGCGAGQLLTRLPSGSLGLEVNPFLVEVLRKARLNIELYDPENDQFSLRNLTSNYYKTFVTTHVLEHFPNAAQKWRILLNSCHRLGIQRVIMVVPGVKGFHADPTHKTFIDRSYLEQESLLNCQGYVATKIQYFPVNLAIIGNYFTFHEFKVVYESV